MLWFQQQYERYGAVVQTVWRVGYGLWRVVRIPLNPLARRGPGDQRDVQRQDRRAALLSSARQRDAEFVLAVGRAAIDLYSGRLALSDEELHAARARELAATTAAPLRRCGSC